MRMQRAVAFLAAAILVCGGAWSAAGWGFSPEIERNWPQWRGPRGLGVSETADPPVAWSETKNVRWKVKIPGRGTSTPIIWEDRVFLQTAIPTAGDASASADAPAALSPQGRRAGGPIAFTLLCLDRKTGRILWRKVAREETPHEGHHPDHGFASHSPVTDGTLVIAYFGSRGIHCYDFQGNLKWSRDLGKMRTKMGFGEGSSPALFGETVVVNWDHEGEDFLVALDKRTGRERWRQLREEDTSWSTPLVVPHNGRAQVVTAATRRIRSYDLETGRPLWEHAGLTANAIPSPVSGEGVLFATSGFRGSALYAIRLGGEGDLTGSEAVLWSHHRSTPYVPSPLLYQGRLYFLASNNAILSCFDAKSGKPLFETERVEGLQGVYASPVGAAGRVYLVGRNGTTVVLKASDRMEILATNPLEERIDASPALAGRDLFLRGQESLYCISQQPVPRSSPQIH